jgi:cytoskeletal protein CcmA (bactofilin family)
MEGLAKANANAVDSINFAGCSEFSGNAQSRNIIVEKGAVINAKLTTEKN